jgi:hypothetical protein
MARPADRQGSEASRPGQGSGGKEPETVSVGATKPRGEPETARQAARRQAHGLPE